MGKWRNEEIPSKCSCGGDIIERIGPYGKFYGCTGYPGCNTSYPKYGNKGHLKRAANVEHAEEMSAQIGRMTDIIIRFADHDGACRRKIDGTKCTCGLSDALRSVGIHRS